MFFPWISLHLCHVIKNNMFMRAKPISIFNLITLLSRQVKRTTQRKIDETDCETHFHHDYYCETAKAMVPFR